MGHPGAGGEGRRWVAEFAHAAPFRCVGHVCETTVLLPAQRTQQACSRCLQLFCICLCCAPYHSPAGLFTPEEQALLLDQLHPWLVKQPELRPGRAAAWEAFIHRSVVWGRCGCEALTSFLQCSCACRGTTAKCSQGAVHLAVVLYTHAPHMRLSHHNSAFGASMYQATLRAMATPTVCLSTFFAGPGITCTSSSQPAPLALLSAPAVASSPRWSTA